MSHQIVAQELTPAANVVSDEPIKIQRLYVPSEAALQLAPTNEIYVRQPTAEFDRRLEAYRTRQTPVLVRRPLEGRLQATFDAATGRLQGSARFTLTSESTSSVVVTPWGMMTTAVRAGNMPIPWGINARGDLQLTLPAKTASITIDWELNPASSRNGWSYDLSVPLCPILTLTLSAPVAPIVRASCPVEATGSDWVLALDGATSHRLQLAPPGAQAPLEPIRLWQVERVFHLEEHQTTESAELRLDALHEPISEMVVTLDREIPADVLRSSAPTQWSLLETTATHAVWRGRFRQPVIGPLRLTYQASHPNRDRDRRRPTPIDVKDALFRGERLTFVLPTGLRISQLDDGDYLLTGFRRGPAGLSIEYVGGLLAGSAPQPPTLTWRADAPEPDVEADWFFDSTKDRPRIAAVLHWTGRSGNAREVAVEAPSGWSVTRVDLGDGLRNGTTRLEVVDETRTRVTIPLPNPLAPLQRLKVVCWLSPTVNDVKAMPDRPLPAPVVWPIGRLTRPVRCQVYLDPARGLSLAGHVAATGPPAAFPDAVTAPTVEPTVFELTRRSPAVQVIAQDRPTQYEAAHRADWRRHDGQWRVRWSLRIHQLAGRLDELVVHATRPLPAELRWRMSDADINVKQSAIHPPVGADPVRAYRLTFDEAIDESSELTAEWSTPAAEVDVPLLWLPNAERFVGEARISSDRGEPFNWTARGLASMPALGSDHRPARWRTEYHRAPTDAALRLQAPTPTQSPTWTPIAWLDARSTLVGSVRKDQWRLTLENAAPEPVVLIVPEAMELGEVRLDGRIQRLRAEHGRWRLPELLPPGRHELLGEGAARQAVGRLLPIQLVEGWELLDAQWRIDQIGPTTSIEVDEHWRVKDRWRSEHWSAMQPLLTDAAALPLREAFARLKQDASVEVDVLLRRLGENVPAGWTLLVDVSLLPTRLPRPSLTLEHLLQQLGLRATSSGPTIRLQARQYQQASGSDVGLLSGLMQPADQLALTRQTRPILFALPWSLVVCNPLEPMETVVLRSDLPAAAGAGVVVTSTAPVELWRVGVAGLVGLLAGWLLRPWLSVQLCRRFVAGAVMMSLGLFLEAYWSSAAAVLLLGLTLTSARGPTRPAIAVLLLMLCVQPAPAAPPALVLIPQETPETALIPERVWKQLQSTHADGSIVVLVQQAEYVGAWREPLETAWSAKFTVHASSNVKGPIDAVLQLLGAKVDRVQVDGEEVSFKPASERAGVQLTLPKAGVNVVEVDFVAPVLEQEGLRQLDLQVPLAGRSTLQLTFPEEHRPAELVGDARPSSLSLSGKQIIGTFGPTPRLQCSWRERPPATNAPMLAAEIAHWLQITEEAQDIVSVVSHLIRQGSTTELSLRVGPEVRIRRIDAERLDSWRLTPITGSADRRLHLQFKSLQAGVVTTRIYAALAPAVDGMLPAPNITAEGADGERVIVGVNLPAGWSIEPAEKRATASVAEFTQWWERRGPTLPTQPSIVWKPEGNATPFRVVRSRPEFKAQQAISVSVDPEVLEWRADVTLEAKSLGPRSQLVLPALWELHHVAGAGVVGWTGRTQQTTIWFEPTAEPTVTLTLAGEIKGSPAAGAVVPLAAPRWESADAIKTQWSVVSRSPSWDVRPRAFNDCQPTVDGTIVSEQARHHFELELNASPLGMTTRSNMVVATASEPMEATGRLDVQLTRGQTQRLVLQTPMAWTAVRWAPPAGIRLIEQQTVQGRRHWIFAASQPAAGMLRFEWRVTLPDGVLQSVRVVDAEVLEEYFHTPADAGVLTAPTGVDRLSGPTTTAWPALAPSAASRAWIGWRTLTPDASLTLAGADAPPTASALEVRQTVVEMFATGRFVRLVMDWQLRNPMAGSASLRLPDRWRLVDLRLDDEPLTLVEQARPTLSAPIQQSRNWQTLRGIFVADAPESGDGRWELPTIATTSTEPCDVRVWTNSDLVWSVAGTEVKPEAWLKQRWHEYRQRWSQAVETGEENAALVMVQRAVRQWFQDLHQMPDTPALTATRRSLEREWEELLQVRPGISSIDAVKEVEVGNRGELRCWEASVPVNHLEYWAPAERSAPSKRGWLRWLGLSMCIGSSVCLFWPRLREPTTVGDP